MTTNVKSPKQAKVKISKLVKQDESAKEVLNNMFDAIKPAKLVKVSTYKTNVLSVNAELKIERSTFASALKVLNVLMPESAPAIVKNTAKLALKDNAKFDALKLACKPSKSGKYSPFGILQGINRINNK